eukprot:m.306794 g.306794  ORF g.306794 m.306794 type:complete len:124 (-) comp16354_c0_seq2:1150-1521(-)
MFLSITTEVLCQSKETLRFPDVLLRFLLVICADYSPKGSRLNDVGNKSKRCDKAGSFFGSVSSFRILIATHTAPSIQFFFQPAFPESYHNVYLDTVQTRLKWSIEPSSSTESESCKISRPEFE